MKHIKLFESFSTGGSFKPGDVVIGVLSEGVDVSVFPEDKAMEIMSHLNSLASDYYHPFMIKFEKEDLTFLNADRLFLFVDFNNEIKKAHAESGMDLDVPSVNVGGIDLLILDEYQISILGDEIDILLYTKNGEEGDNKEMGYGVELVGGDQYMEVQSWGQELKNGAYNHFMSFRSDD
jgi:hypothetical protein